MSFCLLQSQFLARIHVSSGCTEYDSFVEQDLAKGLIFNKVRSDSRLVKLMRSASAFKPFLGEFFCSNFLFLALWLRHSIVYKWTIFKDARRSEITKYDAIKAVLLASALLIQEVQIVRKISFAVVAVAVILSGCASSPKMGNVIPQSGGKYEVVTTGPSNDEALKSGLFSAEATCKERKMRHVITSQSMAYKGMVSEESNKTMDKAAQILTAVTGARIPTLSSDDDYQVKLGFTCEP